MSQKKSSYLIALSVDLLLIWFAVEIFSKLSEISEGFLTGHHMDAKILGQFWDINSWSAVDFPCWFAGKKFPKLDFFWDVNTANGDIHYAFVHKINKV